MNQAAIGRRRSVGTKAAALFVAISIVAGCSGSSDSASDSTASTAPATTAAAVDTTTPPTESMAPELPAPIRPVFVPGNCSFEAAGLDTSTARCGTVEVSMRNGTSDIATLAVTIIGGDDVPNPDPIFHVPGGPGAGAAAYAPILGSTYLGIATATGRQIVFVDQRGTGASEPFLTCDDPSKPKACVDAWAADGIDPLAFTTPNSADDIADVAAALGATSINVWGASYGSRLALEVARRHADLVRSLTIESVDTAASPLDDSADIVAAIDRIGEVCAQDATCSASISNLRGTINDVASDLDEAPFTTSVGVVDTSTFGQSILSLMQAATGRMLVPMFVAAVRDGDVGTADAILASLAAEPPLGGRFSPGMNAVINCADAAPFDPASALAAGPAEPDDLLSSLKWAAIDGQYGSACAAWPHATDGPTAPVDVSTPALILNGLDDSNTPLENAELAAKSLANMTLVAFPATGHFVMHRGGNPCAEKIFAAFVSDPTAVVETTCVPTPSLSMSLVSVAESGTAGLETKSFTDLGVSVKLPVGWLPLGTGAITKDGSVNLQLAPVPFADMVPQIAEQYGLSPAPTPSKDVNGSTWSLLSGSTADGEVRIAAAEAGDSTLVLIVAGSGATAIDALFDQTLASIAPL